MRFAGTFGLLFFIVTTSACGDAGNTQLVVSEKLQQYVRLFNSGQEQQAIENLRVLAGENPARADLHYELARELFLYAGADQSAEGKQAEYAEAFRNNSQAIALTNGTLAGGEQSARYELLSALILTQDGQCTSAIPYYKNVFDRQDAWISHNDIFSKSLVTYAGCLQEVGKADEAIPMLQRSLEGEYTAEVASMYVFLLTIEDRSKGQKAIKNLSAEKHNDAALEAGYCTGLVSGQLKAEAIDCFNHFLARNDLTPPLILVARTNLARLQNND